MTRVRLRAAYRNRAGVTGRRGQVVALDDAVATRLLATGRAVALAEPGGPEPEPAKPRRRRRKPPADDAFLNPDVPVQGNQSRI